MTIILDRLYEWLWGTPMLVLILGVGIWLTIRTRCVQVRLFPCLLYTSPSPRD